jgi:hemolysin III
LFLKGELIMTTLSQTGRVMTAPATTRSAFRLKDPASCITHFIGMVAALSVTPFLLEKAATYHNPLTIISCFLFMASMVLLYGASATYHAVIAGERVTMRLKKLDHIMIYFLIAGSYTPVCLLVLPRGYGVPLCAVIWGLAFAGLFLTAVWVTSPKWLNSTIYIIMGWLCIVAIRSIYENLPSGGFFWLLTGGILYTIGGVIYALKSPLLSKLHPEFGAHEIFHLFVMAGSLCHFIMVYAYLL